MPIVINYILLNLCSRAVCAVRAGVVANYHAANATMQLGFD